jgi:sulfite exporter TauE/SafE
LVQVALVMALFGIGAAAPLVLIGLASRELVMRWRGRLLAAGSAGKGVLGAAMVVIALVIATGADRRIETILTAWSPAWLADLTTRF